MAGKTKRDPFRFCYRTGTRIWLIAITAALLVLLPVTWLDRQGAWLNNVPVVFAAVLVFALYFLYVLLSESNQVIEVRKESIYAKYGIGPLCKETEIPFDDIAALTEDTTLFSIGRKYSIRSVGDEKGRIRLTSALNGYKDLLHLLAKRIPREKIAPRAQKSLQKYKVIS